MTSVLTLAGIFGKGAPHWRAFRRGGSGQRLILALPPTHAHQDLPTMHSHSPRPIPPSANGIRSPHTVQLSRCTTTRPHKRTS